MSHLLWLADEIAGPSSLFERLRDRDLLIWDIATIDTAGRLMKAADQVISKVLFQDEEATIRESALEFILQSLKNNSPEELIFHDVRRNYGTLDDFSDSYEIESSIWSSLKISDEESSFALERLRDLSEEERSTILPSLRNLANILELMEIDDIYPDLDEREWSEFFDIVGDIDENDRISVTSFLYDLLQEDPSRTNLSEDISDTLKAIRRIHPHHRKAMLNLMLEEFPSLWDSESIERAYDIFINYPQSVEFVSDLLSDETIIDEGGDDDPRFYRSIAKLHLCESLMVGNRLKEAGKAHQIISGWREELEEIRDSNLRLILFEDVERILQ